MEERLNFLQKVKWYLSERRRIFYYAIIVMLISTLPYLLGYFTQGNGWCFTGFVFGVEDGNSYIAKMLGGAEGAWLFRTPYTASPQKGVLAFLPYLLLGKLTSPPGQHEQLVVLFHLFRIVAGVLAILATYDFVSLVIKQSTWRWWSLVLITLGGGLGWILIIIGQQNWLGSMPLEFYSPESFGFLELFGLPHLALGRALLMWGMLFILRPFKQEGIWDKGGLIAGVLWLLLGLMQPLTVVLAWTVIGVFLTLLIVRHLYFISGGQVPDKQTWKSYLWRVIISIMISCPIVIYTFLAFNSDAYLKGWTAQNVILSPHPLHYLLAYGLLLPFAIIGIYGVFTKGDIQGHLLAGWLILFPFLIYIPYNLQRRLAEGVWVVFVILSVKSVEVWQESRLNIRRTRLFKSAAVLLFPSTMLLFMGGLLAAGQPREPLFLPNDVVKVFLSLRQHADPGAVVLSSFDIGNALPAWAPFRVVIGHGPESVGLSELSQQVTAFYDHNSPDSERLGLISDLNIRYVFWGPNERSLAIQVNHQSWDPHQAYYLREINRSGDYTVFEVIQ